MQLASSLVMLFSVLLPSRIWYAPTMPLHVEVKTGGPVTLVLTDFTGKVLEQNAPRDVTGGVTVDLKELFPRVSAAGTYVLWAVPQGKSISEFIGTPLVISVRTDKRVGPTGGVVVTKIEPLRYTVITTEQGAMTLVFYYDVAPHTVEAFQLLSEQGYYDGLTFHRILPGQLVQGGDPRGDGKGGPGFTLPAEFNDRKHEEGTVAIARLGDPLEPQLKPRHEFANSGGSQFYICLTPTVHLDGRYTVFGKVVEGMDVAKALSAVARNERTAAPLQPLVIKKIEVKPVAADKNPYRAIMNQPEAAKEATIKEQ